MIKVYVKFKILLVLNDGLDAVYYTAFKNFVA